MAPYITDLPRRVVLSGHTWYNVRDDDTKFYLYKSDRKGLILSDSFEAGYYYYVSHLRPINKALSRMSRPNSATTIYLNG